MSNNGTAALTLTVLHTSLSFFYSRMRTLSLPPVPSPAAEHWQQHPTVPTQPSTAHGPPVAYSKPVALVPTPVEPRGSHVARPDMEKAKQRQGTIAEVSVPMRTHQQLENVLVI